MNTQGQDNEECSASTTPSPGSPSSSRRQIRIAVVLQFVVTKFWWIVAGAALLKLLCYFIAPSQNLTAGGHFARLLKGFVSYGGILAVVAFILSKCVKKPNVFRVAFALLFALACLLDFPIALVRSRTDAAVDDLLKSYAKFEALMKYEEDPVWMLRPSAYHPGMRNRPYGDGDKYFMLSYCYANGYDGYPKDIGKAVRLCQMAATEGKYDAQSLLRKAGFSWQEKKY